MSGEKIVHLVPSSPPSAVDGAVVGLLERMLADARAGHFNGVAIITITSDQSGAYSALGTAFEGAGVHQNAHTAVGGCEVLKRRMLEALFEWSR